MRKDLMTLNTFVAVLAACETLALVFYPEKGQRLLDALTEGHWLVWVLTSLLAAAVIVLNVWAALREYKEEEGRRDLEVHTDQGKSVVSTTALESELKGALETVGDISHLRLRLHVRGEGMPVQCHAAFRIRSQADVMARLDAIKQVLRETFSRLLPNVGLEITTDIRDFAHDGAPPPLPPAAPAEESSEFQGPVYPDELDDSTQA